MLPVASWDWASTQCQWFLVLHVGQFTFQLVADIHVLYIGHLYLEKLQPYAPWCILRMSVSRESRFLFFACSVIWVSIGCRNPLIYYLHPFLAQTPATCSLPNPTNERQWIVNSFSCGIFGNQQITRMIELIIEVMTALMGNYTMYQRQNTDSQLINIVSCKQCKNPSLVVAIIILILYY